MIIRCLFITVICLYSVKCFAQKHDTSDFIKDIHDIPIFGNYDSIANCWEYLTLDKKRILVNPEIEYIEGRDSLNRYCRRKYYELISPTYNELNYVVLLSILFDKHLNIKEIRIIKPIFPYHREYYENLFIQIAKSTQGKWKKTTENRDWYIHFIAERFF